MEMRRISWIVICLLGVVLPVAQSFAQESLSSNGVVQLSGEIANRVAKHAGDKAKNWQQMYQAAPAEYQAALAFQLQHMPPADLKKLEPDFVLLNTRLAYQAINSASWREQVSEALFLNDVLPYANIDETREDWRSDFYKKFSPLVKECRTPGEAAQKLNREVFNLVNVHYSTKRRKANQSPSESIEQGMASCTGLSILLVDACRSVGVPARLAGIPSWVDKRGNHTWVEVWDNGKWHFTGADEPSDKGLNHAWFQGDASKALKGQRMNSIYAVSFMKTETRFPMVWSRDGSKTVYAVNVTDRYTESEVEPVGGAKLRIRVWQAAGKDRVPASVSLLCQECVGAEPMTGTSKAGRSDMNDMLEFDVVPGRTYQLKVRYLEQELTSEIKIDESEANEPTIQVHEVYLAESN